LLPPRLHPLERLRILERFIGAPQKGAQLAGVMLDVPDVVDVERSARKRQPGKTRAALVL
jgi:hypothetical protein